MIYARMLALFAVAVTLGCASSSTVSTGPRSSSQVIYRKEIAEAGVVGSAWDVISRLRPNFLSSRGRTSVSTRSAGSDYPTVWVDGQLFGQLASLRTIDATQIAEIRKYQA